MELVVGNLVIVIDPSVVSDPAPQTPQERIAFVQDAISHANNILGKGHGISIRGLVEDKNILVYS